MKLFLLLLLPCFVAVKSMSQDSTKKVDDFFGFNKTHKVFLDTLPCNVTIFTKTGVVQIKGYKWQQIVIATNPLEPTKVFTGLIDANKKTITDRVLQSQLIGTFPDRTTKN